MTILVTGPESSGKSTLARSLAWCLDGHYVAEAARAYLNARRGAYAYPDLERILALQSAALMAARSGGASFVVCDTGPEVLRVWSEVKFGRCSPGIIEAQRRTQFDLVLLCYPDLPWVADPLREAPRTADRQRLYHRYRDLMPTARVIRGDQRTGQALTAVLARAQA